MSDMSDLSLPSAPARRYDHAEYRLIGGAGQAAVAAGLANATWYRCPLPRAQLKELMQRDDTHALRDTLLWYALIVASGLAGWAALSGAINGWWALPAFFAYGALYCGAADSRWHEAGHGTAFKTRWVNDVLYQLASFQVFRRPTVWRWSHARHHTDTLVVGRDPEVAAKVPTQWLVLASNVFALTHVSGEVRKLLLNFAGRMDHDEKTFVPESMWPKVFLEARVWVAVYAAVFAWCAALGSIAPLLFIGAPSLYGAWLYHFFGLTQHAGMPENVHDHRLCCRTVQMNPVFRFLYWNMNYHAEHHMVPQVPYHALPKLQAALASDMPTPYPSTIAAYREILPMLARQAREPWAHVKRELPAGGSPGAPS
jgi:fatty acid desaturase